MGLFRRTRFRDIFRLALLRAEPDSPVRVSAAANVTIVGFMSFHHFKDGPPA
jgi:hypothetical protein